MLRPLPLLLLPALACAAVACSSDGGTDDGRPVVAAAFYPLEEIARQVGGDAVRIVTLVPPGEEAHEYEPTPKQLTELEDADVVLYLGKGFQPNIEKALESLPSSVQRVDLLDGLPLLDVTAQVPGSDGESEGESIDGGKDPHVWLSPVLMQQMSETARDTLGAVDAPAQAAFAANQSGFAATLAALDSDFTAGLATCASRFLVSSHRAFGYLADAYDLTAVAIAGVSPTEEPSAKTLEALATFARDNDVATIFFEENLPDDLAATLAAEVGAGTGVLDTLESPSDDQRKAGEDYDSLMRANLDALRIGLGCS
ncbi:MAG: metal ABC transporter solute-binding protein, Zn/Mn family [Ilumatobacteraceae bacterium]